MIRTRLKLAFFDRPAVLAATSKAERRVSNRFGATVRKIARRSMKKVGKRRRQRAAELRRRGRSTQGVDSSKPGQPPRVHVGTLKKLIFYSFDFRRHSVVIGPTQSGRGTGAPDILEHGGTTTIRVPERRRGGRRRLVKKRVRIAPRPFMQPAFDKTRPELSQLWKDVIRRR